MQHFDEWQQLERDHLVEGGLALTREQQIELRSEPHRAIEIYTSAGFKHPKDVVAASAIAKKSSDEFMAKYKDEFMKLLGEERLEVLQLIEIYRANRKNEDKE
jgi:propanediol dehydratase large subunit